MTLGALQKPMFTERKYFGAACLCGKIYAVGRVQWTRALEGQLNVMIHSQTSGPFVAPMLMPRMYHGVVTLGGLLYAVGGHCGANRLSSMECYDPQTNVWTPVSSMSKCTVEP